MPKRKQLFLSLLLLLISSLACLSTTEPIASHPTGTPTPVADSTDVPAAAVVAGPTQTRAADAKQGCAVISASEALRLRVDPDPHSRVLAFMRGGEVVKLISSENADWWLIKRRGITGYARSKYLDLHNCP